MSVPKAAYIPPPKTLPGFPKAKGTKPKTSMGGGKKRKRWINDDDDILEWDYQHGKIERYNDKRKHKGEYDPDKGTQTKPADPTRHVTPTIRKKRKEMQL
jgi:Cytotoxic